MQWVFLAAYIAVMLLVSRFVARKIIESDPVFKSEHGYVSAVSITVGMIWPVSAIGYVLHLWIHAGRKRNDKDE